MRNTVSNGTLKIGALAAQADVNVQTVRFYERVGLLETPSRSPAGYRVYRLSDVSRIRFIKNAQHLGFSLAEIGDLLKLRQDRRKSCRHVRAMVQSKMADLAERVAGLRTMEGNLVKLIKTCSKESSASACPIMDALDAGKIGAKVRSLRKSALTKASKRRTIASGSRRRI